jgi:serine/threonine-protein kinase RsbW
VALSNSPPIYSSLQVQTDLSALEKVLQWFEQFYLSPLPSKIWEDCQQVLVEGFTNVVRYAHQHLPSTTNIDIELAIFDCYLEIKIWDWGHPFDWQAELQRRLEEENIEQEGGRGLIWIYRLTNDVQYFRTRDHRNCLLMRKNLPG